MEKREVNYYKVFLENGKQVHFRDGTPRLVTDKYIKDNECMFDHKNYVFDHSEIVEK